VPLSLGLWEVVSWKPVFDALEPGEGGNVVMGNAIVIDSHANLIRSDGPKVAAIGVDDLVIIATGDSVLVTRLSHAQKVREAAEWFEKERGDGNATDRK
jgi:mannose-1-phosphate guanylyltransferase